MEEEEEVPGHHDDGSMQISMEGVEFPQLYEHPLITSIRFAFTRFVTVVHGCGNLLWKFAMEIAQGLLNYDGTQEEEKKKCHNFTIILRYLLLALLLVGFWKL
ncbi:hypothetical protein YC2023_081357 [Brassica napus]